MAKANCSHCGKELEEISYVVPDPNHILGRWEEASQRPPLCRECWEKACRELGIDPNLK